MLDFYRSEMDKYLAYSEELEKSNEKIKGELYNLKLKEVKSNALQTRD